MPRGGVPAPAPAPSVEARLTIVSADRALGSDFAADVRAGLTARRKHLPCRYFYDAAGSALFEEICALPEYYLTRAEDAILRANADAIIAAASAGAMLVELGSGSAAKTRALIEAALRAGPELGGQSRAAARYVPIDISRSMLEESSRLMLADYPALEIIAIAAEYRAGLRWLGRRREPKLVLWLGSNVGNFTRGEAAAFLRSVRATMSAGDRLLLGVDLRKSRAVLEAAYDDPAGVTARFNLNLLARINRELGGDFAVGAFAHRARWNERLGRVEIDIVSRHKQRVRIEALGLTVAFGEGERIYTESSYKYSLDEIDVLARAAGTFVERRWLDDEGRFSVSLLAPLSG